jgi:hypothetical protein
MNGPVPSSNSDLEQLRILSILHYVMAGITVLFSFFGLAYVAMGIFITSGGFEGHRSEDRMVGWFIMAFGTVAFLAALALATAMFMAARSISRRTRHTFCVVVAALSCLFFPFGTALGVFSLIVLTRSSVKALFESRPVS